MVVVVVMRRTSWRQIIAEQTGGDGIATVKLEEVGLELRIPVRIRIRARAIDRRATRRGRMLRLGDETR